MEVIWQAALTFIIFIIFATFHEYGHGWMANRLGDSTAKRSGRLSLNPLVHIDPMWTIIMPIMLLISSGGRFALGSAKPVPVNPMLLRDPKRSMVWVGMAGPSTNIIWALIIIVLMKTGMNTGLFLPGGRLHLNYAPYLLLFKCLQINIMLLVFNMLPIPPLDGSKILEGLLPDRYAEEYSKVGRFGFLIIIMLMISGVLGQLLGNVITLVIKIFAL